MFDGAKPRDLQFRGPLLETLKFTRLEGVPFVRQSSQPLKASWPTATAHLTDRDLTLRNFRFWFEPFSRGWAHRQADLCSAAGAIQPVGDLKNAAVGFAYLARKREADTAPSRLGGVEGHKQVRRIGEADPIILNQNDHAGGSRFPGDRHLAICWRLGKPRHSRFRCI